MDRAASYPPTLRGPLLYNARTIIASTAVLKGAWMARHSREDRADAAQARAEAAQVRTETSRARADAARTMGARADGAREGRAHVVMGATRYMAIVPCIALLAAAVALMIATLVDTVHVTIEAVNGEVELADMMVEYIEFADFFLLAIVLYIMSIGLYSLFIDDTIPMPKWLEIHNLEDLKEKLIGVIVVVMGVYFLGKLIHGTDAQSLLYMGLGIAAVVFALGYFARFVIIGEEGGGDSAAPSTVIVTHPGVVEEGGDAGASQPSASQPAPGVVVVSPTASQGGEDQSCD